MIELTYGPIPSFLNLGEERPVAQIVADMRTITCGNDKPVRIHPHDTAGCWILGREGIEHTISVLIGYRLRSGEGQSDTHFTAHQALQECLEVLPDGTGKFEIRLHLRFLPVLIPSVKGEGLKEEKGDKDHEEEEEEPLPDPHLRPDAEGISHHTSYLARV